MLEQRGFPGKPKSKDTRGFFGKKAWGNMPEIAARCSGNMAEEGPEDVENPRDDEVAVRQADVGYWDVAQFCLQLGNLTEGMIFMHTTSYCHEPVGIARGLPHHVFLDEMFSHWSAADLSNRNPFWFSSTTPVRFEDSVVKMQGDSPW